MRVEKAPTMMNAEHIGVFAMKHQNDIDRPNKKGTSKHRQLK